MDLSIIIPSFNTKNLLDRCLTSIEVSLDKTKLEYEIIVVDNGSKDGSKEMLNKKYVRVNKIFNKQNIGYGRSNNEAINLAKGKYILLLNSDTKAIDGAIWNLYTFITAKVKAFAEGKLLNEDNSEQPSCGPIFDIPAVFLMLFAKGDKLGFTRYSPHHVSKVDWVSGACLIGKKSSFMDIGLFDENIFMYMDEIDLLYRAKQRGYTTFFVPQARFIHTGAASSGNKRTPVVNIYRGLVYFYKKHRSIMELKLLTFMLKLKASLAMVIGRMTGDASLVNTYDEALKLV